MDKFAESAAQLTGRLPLLVIRQLANLIADCSDDDWAVSKLKVIRNIANPGHRVEIAGFLNSLSSDASQQLVNMVLLTAAECEQIRQEGQSIELVWTGPDVKTIPLRRTEQALLQVIESAARTLTIVSYAVYDIARIRKAIIDASDRGVAINVIIETPDLIEGEHAFNTLRALGSRVAAKCRVWMWPVENRQKDQSGNSGILHVKCAVADSNILFLSSANMTAYAFTLNMELGVLITNGKKPAQVEEIFQHMMDMDILREITK